MARFAALLALALCAAPAAAFVPSVTQRHVAPARLSSASRAPAPLMMAEGEEMILVNEESIGAGASTIAGTAGFIVAGPVFGVIVAAVVNYVAKQENEAGDVARGVGKVALDTFNFFAKLNTKYDLTDKAGSAANGAIDKLKEKDNEGVFDKVEDALATTTDKLSALNDEFDLVSKGKQVVWVAGDLSEKAIEKSIALNDEYKIVDQAVEKAKEATSKATEAAKSRV